MAIKHGRFEVFHDDQLLVALSDLDIVTQALSHLRVLSSRQERFPGWAVWEGCSFAAGVVSGAIAAGTIPGQRSARQVLEDLLHPEPVLRDARIRPHDPANPEGWRGFAVRGRQSGEVS